MFKTVFSKYFTAFLLIFFLSFSLLCGILYWSVRDYSADEKKKMVIHTAENIKETLRQDYQDYIREDPSRNISSYFANEGEAITRILSALSDHSDYRIFLVDAKGQIILSDRNAAGLNGSIPGELCRALYSSTGNGRAETSGDLDGLLPEQSVIYGVKLGMSVSPGVPAGAVFVCSSAGALSVFGSRVIKVLVAACILVMGVGLGVCYFISLRISNPLREMQSAAKKFASGDFSVRVDDTREDEIGELASAFNQMAASLDENERLRDSFISNVSHDLRTPLTSISGFIEGMRDGVIPPEQHPQYLAIVGNEVQRLSRLVATLLDITRIQAGERKFIMKPFDVCEMARQILISFERKIEEKRLEIGFDCEQEKITVLADEDAIHQVLYNLIDNAVKFAREEGILQISLHLNDKKVKIRVYNEGQGIPEEDLGHVFDRFYKADKSRGLDKTGMGLGLFIVKAIIVSHGEALRVQSKEGQWCEFCFTLPMA